MCCIGGTFDEGFCVALVIDLVKDYVSIGHGFAKGLCVVSVIDLTRVYGCIGNKNDVSLCVLMVLDLKRLFVLCRSKVLWEFMLSIGVGSYDSSCLNLVRTNY